MAKNFRSLGFGGLKIDVTGLSVTDLINMPTSEFRGVSTANVKKVTSRLVSAMNKRIKRLGKSEIGQLSPTYQSYQKRGKYSVKGLTRESTIQVFKRLQDSLKKSGTTLRGWKKQREKFFEDFKKPISEGGKFGIDIDFLKDSPETEKKFWELFHHFEDTDSRVANIKSFKYQVMNMIAKKFMGGKRPTQRSIKYNITRLYNQMMEEERKSNRGRSTSSYFDSGNE